MKVNYEKDLSIDEFALDREWKYQPSLYFKYAEQQAIAGKIRDEAKEKLDVVKAELDSIARKELPAFGKKITENQITNWIIQQKTYQEASANLIQANYEANMMANAVRAMDHRKAALENLARLWVGQFYSTPREPPENEGQLEAKIENNKTKKQRQGLKKGSKD